MRKLIRAKKNNRTDKRMGSDDHVHQKQRGMFCVGTSHISDLRSGRQAVLHDIHSVRYTGNGRFPPERREGDPATGTLRADEFVPGTIWPDGEPCQETWNPGFHTALHAGDVCTKEYTMPVPGTVHISESQKEEAERLVRRLALWE